MLSTFIQRYDKKIISFLTQFKNKRLTEISQLSDATFYDRINSIYQFIKPFLDHKCPFLRNMEPLISFNIYPVLWKSVFLDCGLSWVFPYILILLTLLRRCFHYSPFAFILSVCADVLFCALPFCPKTLRSLLPLCAFGRICSITVVFSVNLRFHCLFHHLQTTN